MTPFFRNAYNYRNLFSLEQECRHVPTKFPARPIETYDMFVEILKAGADILAFFGSYEQINGFDIRAGSQKFLHQHFTQKSCTSSNKHAPTPIELGNVGFQ